MFYNSSKYALFFPVTKKALGGTFFLNLSLYSSVISSHSGLFLLRELARF